MKNQSKNELLNTVICSDNSKSRNTALTALIGRADVTCEDLRYVVRYCPSDEVRNTAGTALIGRADVTCEDLRYVVRYCPSDEVRNTAGTALIGRADVTCEDYYELFRRCGTEIIDKALSAYHKHIDVDPAKLPDENTLIKQIAHRVKNSPKCLEMSTWHTCGTTHCIGGHACNMDKTAEKIEKQLNNPAYAAAAVLPHYVKWFHLDNNTAFEKLQSVLN
jgi:hypothetical protein